MIDPVWARLVLWHGETERQIARDRSREDIGRQVQAALGDRAEGFLKAFDAAD